MKISNCITTTTRAARALAVRPSPFPLSSATSTLVSTSSFRNVSYNQQHHRFSSLPHFNPSSSSSSLSASHLIPALQRQQHQQQQQQDNFSFELRTCTPPNPLSLSSTILCNPHSSPYHQQSHQYPQLPLPSPSTFPSSSSICISNHNHRSNPRLRPIRTWYSNPYSVHTIHKRHSHRKTSCSSSSHPLKTRRFSSSSTSTSVTSSSPKKDKDKDTVTWREAFQSPRKAIKYLGQLRHDLVGWAKHMWAGAKLLAADVRVSTKILKRVTQGKPLTRRERNFIVQTGVDLARLVPFSLFLIIPLAEIALPLALRFFPNMLPSQFQDQMKTEENLKRRLKARLELAKYLREVVEEKAKRVQSSDANSELKKNAEDLTDFLDAIRSGLNVSGADISRFAKFFNDELTIDGAARPQLVAMCKYMGLSPYGHDYLLRFKLRSRLNAIKRDDMQIMWEGGVESLTDSEVSKACKDRGIREEVSNKIMREELNDWLELSQKREIPGSLMIMSRALVYGRDLSPEIATAAAPIGTAADVIGAGAGVAEDMAKVSLSADATKAKKQELEKAIEEEDEIKLKETLGSMPEDVIMDVKQAADHSARTTMERLEETLRQEKLIELESERIERKEKEDEKKRKKREEEEEEQVEEQQALEQERMMQVGTNATTATATADGVTVAGTMAGGVNASTNGSGVTVATTVTTTTTNVKSDAESISDKHVLSAVEQHENAIRKDMMASSEGSVESVQSETGADVGAGASTITTTTTTKTVVMEEEEELKRRERIRAMLVSLGEMSSDSSVEAEREELRNLKVQLAEAEGLVHETTDASSSSSSSSSSGTTAEMRNFKQLVSRLEREVERVDAKVGLRMKLLDQDNDGVMSLEEVRMAMHSLLAADGTGADAEHDQIVNETLERLDADDDGNISRADLKRMLHEMQFEYGLVDSPGSGTNSGESGKK